MPAKGALCSTAEASRLLGVTPPTVIAWVRQGKLRGHQQNDDRRRPWRVEVRSIDEHLEANPRGARRGRPRGSLSGLLEELATLRQRVETLESSGPTTQPGVQLAILTAVLQLLQTEGADSAVRMQAIAATAQKLAALLEAETP